MVRFEEHAAHIAIVANLIQAKSDRGCEIGQTTYASAGISTSMKLPLSKIFNVRKTPVVFRKETMLPSFGSAFAVRLLMVKKSLEQRVSLIEAQFAGKTLKEHFREQAGLIDRLFAYRFEELDKEWGPRFGAAERDVGTLRADVHTLKANVSALKADVSGLKADVSALKKDMVIVREGIAVLLKRA